MKRSVLAFAALVVAAWLGGCAGSATNSLVPGAQGPAADLHEAVPGGNVLLRPAVRGHRKPAKAHILLHIPAKRGRNGKLVPAYVSPYTRSLTVSVDGQAPVNFGVSVTSPNCAADHGSSAMHPHQGGISFSCSFVLQTTGGAHVFTFATWDGANGSGNELSANQNVPFTVVPGSNQPLAVTLGGIPTGFLYFSESPWLVTSESGAISLYGHKAATLFVAPLDADHSVIVGPGAPALALAVKKPGKAVVATPAPDSPNLWKLTSTFAAANPTVPSTAFLEVTVTPDSSTGVPPFTVPVTMSLYEPWVYVANQLSSTVGVTNENGAVRMLTYQYAFSHVPDPSGVAYDPDNLWPYIPSIDDNVICVYGLMGNLITVSGAWNDLYAPTDLTYVPGITSGLIYVVNNGFTSFARKAPHAVRPQRVPFSPASPSPAGVTAYDAQGNLQTLSGSFNGLLQPRGIVYANGFLYVTDESENTVEVFDTNGNKITDFSSTLPDVSYGGIAFDSTNQQFYAIDESDGTIVAFDSSGGLYTLPQGAFAGLNTPNGIAYDPYNDELYVSNGGTDEVWVFDSLGNKIRSFASNGDNPWGLTIVP